MGYSLSEAELQTETPMRLTTFVVTEHHPNTKAYLPMKQVEGSNHDAVVTYVAKRRCDPFLPHAQNAEPYNPNKTR